MAKKIDETEETILTLKQVLSNLEDRHLGLTFAAT